MSDPLLRYRSPGLQPMFVYLPDYSLQAPLPLDLTRRPIHRVKPFPAQPIFNQRPSRPRPQLLPTQNYAHSLDSMPLLFPVPVPMLSAEKALELDISDWLAGLEESIKTEEESVVLASSDNKKTSLLLKPVAKAVAGPKGVAVASPVAQAILRRGQDVSIDFDPEAVAIAGPGGTADAQPKLVISYINESQNLSSLTSTPSDELTPSSETSSTTSSPETQTTQKQ